MAARNGPGREGMPRPTGGIHRHHLAPFFAFFGAGRLRCLPTYLLRTASQRHVASTHRPPFVPRQPKPSTSLPATSDTSDQYGAALVVFTPSTGSTISSR